MLPCVRRRVALSAQRSGSRAALHLGARTTRCRRMRSPPLALGCSGVSDSAARHMAARMDAEDGFVHPKGATGLLGPPRSSLRLSIALRPARSLLSGITTFRRKKVKNLFHVFNPTDGLIFLRSLNYYSSNRPDIQH